MVLAIITTVVVPALLITVATVVLGRRRIVAGGEFDSDSVSFIGGVLAALFTVVFAFYIVFAWQTGDDIESNADAEADALIDAFWQANVAPVAHRAELHDLIHVYATQVTESEWGLLDEGKVDPRVPEIIDSLRASFTALPTDDVAVEVAREQGLLDVRQIDENHRARVDDATSSNTLNRVLLGGTLVGAVLMIAFPLLAGLSFKFANVLVMVILTATLGATIFLSIQLIHPLDGMFGVEPSAFLEVLDEMQRAT